MSSLPVPSQPMWARFSADPRTSPALRASDADRDVAADAINAAFSDGRLDSAEHSERLSAVLAAKRLGDLPPLLADIVTSGRRTGTSVAVPAESSGREGLLKSAAVRSWLGLTVLFNVIWIATWLFAGNAPYYYWPIWPMIGTAIPVAMGLMISQSVGRHPERRERRQALRDARYEARLERYRGRASGPGDESVGDGV